MIDFDKIKWSEWMEDTIQHMVEDDVDRVMLVAIRKDGCVCVATSPEIDVNDLALAGFWLTDEAHRWVAECEEDEEDAEDES